MTKINIEQSSDLFKSTPQDGGNASAVKKTKKKKINAKKKQNSSFLALNRTLPGTFEGNTAPNANQLALPAATADKCSSWVPTG